MIYDIEFEKFEKFSWPNYSKVTVECEWKEKVFKSYENRVSQWKKVVIIRKKNEIFKNWGKAANLMQNADKMVIFLKNAFLQPKYGVFERNRNFSKLGNISERDNIERI